MVGSGDSGIGEDAPGGGPWAAAVVPPSGQARHPGSVTEFAISAKHRQDASCIDHSMSGIVSSRAVLSGSRGESGRSRQATRRPRCPRAPQPARLDAARDSDEVLADAARIRVTVRLRLRHLRFPAVVLAPVPFRDRLHGAARGGDRLLGWNDPVAREDEPVDIIRPDALFRLELK